MFIHGSKWLWSRFLSFLQCRTWPFALCLEFVNSMMHHAAGRMRSGLRWRFIIFFLTGVVGVRGPDSHWCCSLQEEDLSSDVEWRAHEDNSGRGPGCADRVFVCVVLLMLAHSLSLYRSKHTHARTHACSAGACSGCVWAIVATGPDCSHSRLTVFFTPEAGGRTDRQAAAGTETHAVGQHRRHLLVTGTWT